VSAAITPCSESCATKTNPEALMLCARAGTISYIYYQPHRISLRVRLFHYQQIRGAYQAHQVVTQRKSHSVLD
jgi:hypothetical protein